MRNAPEFEKKIWCPRTKSVATAMFQRPNNVFEFANEPYSARSKWFDLLEESLCDTPFEAVRYGSVRPGPEHPYLTFSRHRYDIKSRITQASKFYHTGFHRIIQTVLGYASAARLLKQFLCVGTNFFQRISHRNMCSQEILLILFIFNSKDILHKISCSLEHSSNIANKHKK